MSTITGTKGSDVYTTDGVGNHLVALSALLVRGVDSITVECLLEKVLAESSDNKPLEDLMVLAFQNRMPRGGKGERDVFRILYSLLLAHEKTFPLALDLMDLIPEYGYWKDLLKLVPPFQGYAHGDRINEIVRTQFLNDEQAVYNYSTAVASSTTGVEVPKPTVSLLAKWLPREGHLLAIRMAGLLVPGKMLYATRMKITEREYRL